jgi:hypothetical protein
MFKKLNGMAMKNDNYSFIVFKNDRKKKPGTTLNLADIKAHDFQLIASF